MEIPKVQKEPTGLLPHFLYIFELAPKNQKISQHMQTCLVKPDISEYTDLFF